jgi:hypothetical protein
MQNYDYIKLKTVDPLDRKCYDAKDNQLFKVTELVFKRITNSGRVV